VRILFDRMLLAQLFSSVGAPDLPTTLVGSTEEINQQEQT